jgi:hypothetical protein
MMARSLESLKMFTPITFAGTLTSVHTVATPTGEATQTPAAAFVTVALETKEGYLQFIHLRQIHEDEIELSIGGRVL